MSCGIDENKQKRGRDWLIKNILFKVVPNLFPDVRSKTSPSFFHLTIGMGWPFGGEHLRTASSPRPTSVSLGMARKSSLKSEILCSKLIASAPVAG